MNTLDFLRTSALLHDIGKPGCWAIGGRWNEHIQHTFDIVRGLLDEEHAWAAMKHHTGKAYPKKYHPETEEQWIIWLADNLSSGSDRQEQTTYGTRRPSPPFNLTHPLSNGDKTLQSHDNASLHKINSETITGLRSSIKEAGASDTYQTIYHFLESSSLRLIPADTRPPVNDVSLWHHCKLTAAISTCIHKDGGWKTRNPTDYSFSLLSGDGDHVSSFILESSRLPDLNARSQKVKTATSQASASVAELIGPECVLFSGGGSLLALSPVKQAEEAAKRLSNAFTEAMDGEVSITTNIFTVSGDELMNRFGEAWLQAGHKLRKKKLERLPPINTPIEAETKLCDVCQRRPAAHEDEERILPFDTAPRPEALCQECWNLRQRGKGVWLENVVGASGYFAFIKADGDDMGNLLAGDGLKKMGKKMTPSRLAMLSSLINEVCEESLTKIVARYGGRTVFAGGDDILAILPGDQAMDAAIELSNSFKEAMNHSATMSAGISLMHRRLPVYAGLGEVYGLIESAKSNPGKDSVAYKVVGSVASDQEPVEAYNWSTLDRVLMIVDYFNQGDIPNTQIRRIVTALKDNPVKAETWIKAIMGRRTISTEQGEMLLEFLGTGCVVDAFMLNNLLKVRKDE